MFAALRTLIAQWFQPPPTTPAAEQEPGSPPPIPEFLLASQNVEEHPSSQPVPYDENLLERARTQWQFGDWESLSKIERDSLQHHPDRAKLALLAASGHLQKNNSNAARQLIQLAQDWGCSKKLLSQILVAGVHNSLGRAAVTSGMQSRALEHFQSAIVIGTPGADQRLLTQARINGQLQQLSGSVARQNLLPVAQRSEENSGSKPVSPSIRIVILRLDNIGDHVLGSPILRGLRTHYPNGEIVVIANKHAAGYYENCPLIDRLVCIDPPTTQNLNTIEATLQKSDLEHFDVLINPRFAEDYYYACVVASFIDADRKIAFRQNRSVLDNTDPDAYYDDLIDVTSEELHTVEYGYLLLAHLGIALRPTPETWQTEDDSQRIGEMFREAGLDTEQANVQLIVVGIGATSKNRRWPKEAFVELVNHLPQAFKVTTHVVLVGGEEENSDAQFIKKEAPHCLNLVSKTSLSELSALCSIASLYIGPDSGPKHIAAANGCPVVEISHCPEGHKSRARSSDTMGRCWAALTPNFILAQPAATYSDKQIEQGESIRSIKPDEIALLAIKFFGNKSGRPRGPEKKYTSACCP